MMWNDIIVALYSPRNGRTNALSFHHLSSNIVKCLTWLNRYLYYAHESEGLLSRIKAFLPFIGGNSHSHRSSDVSEPADQGLLGIAWFVFIL